MRAALVGAVEPDTVTVELRTLTPLYTGGIGQQGDQLQPSGMLGSIRYFSCLLAAGLGDDAFESACWGLVGEDTDVLHGKRVSLSFNTSNLQTIKLPSPIKLSNDPAHRGWYFNTAQHGKLTIRMTRLTGLSDFHWNLLLLAVRIQVRYATFGAKDQFGLGVLSAGELPKAAPLQDDRSAIDLPDVPGLHRAFFAQIHIQGAIPIHKDSKVHWKPRLELGLSVRQALRNAFRPAPPSTDRTKVRHYVMGWMQTNPKYGTAVNVSACYPHNADNNDDNHIIRIWGVFPHTEPSLFLSERDEVLKALRKAAFTWTPNIPNLRLNRTGLVWYEYGFNGKDNMRSLVNQLAGVASS